MPKSNRKWGEYRFKGGNYILMVGKANSKGGEGESIPKGAKAPCPPGINPARKMIYVAIITQKFITLQLSYHVYVILLMYTIMSCTLIEQVGFHKIIICNQL